MRTAIALAAPRARPLSRASTRCAASKKAARKGKKAVGVVKPPPSDDVVASRADEDDASSAPAAPAASYGGLGYDGDNFIPYGNTSGAALRITDVMLSVGDVDLLSEASCAVMPGQVVGLVGGERMREIHAVEVHRGETERAGWGDRDLERARGGLL